MPNSSPAPRRASGAGRPGGASRGGAGRPSGPRDASSGRRFGAPVSRTPRDGAERRIDRASSASRGGAPRRDGDARPYGDRTPSSRPRPEGRGGDRPARPYSERSGAPRSYRDGATAPRDGADRPRRYDRDDASDDRRGRPSSATRGGAPRRGPSKPDSRGGRPSMGGRAATGGRNERDTRSYGRDTRDLKSDRFDRNKPRPQRKSRPVREISPEEIAKQRAAEFGREKGWGGVARKGGMNINSTGQAMESTPSAGYNPDPLSAWVEEVRPERPSTAPKAKPKVKYSLPGDIASEVRRAFIGTSYMREKMVITLTKAAEGYDRKRWEEALRLGRIVSDAVPGVASVRELTGLAAYRAERWNMAKIHLTAAFTISGDPEHLPLIMDCDRANRRFRGVEKTYHMLEESEPTADTIAEGRIVMASALADQKKYTEAIDLLVRAGGTKMLKNPAYRHVRLWYALADIFDRSGDQVSARELFARVVLADPEAYDAKDRLAELGATPTLPKNRKRRTQSVSKKKVD